MIFTVRFRMVSPLSFAMLDISPLIKGSFLRSDAVRHRQDAILPYDVVTTAPVGRLQTDCRCKLISGGSKRPPYFYGGRYVLGRSKPLPYGTFCLTLFGNIDNVKE